MDIIRGGAGRKNYDEVEDAEPILIDGIPYMVMGHAQYYVDSRILACTLGEKSTPGKCHQLYHKFVNDTDNTINYINMTNDILVNSGLEKLINRHLDSLGPFYRLIDDFDLVHSKSTIGKLPNRPPRRPNALTPDDLKTWANAIAECLRERKLRVPNFRYPIKCNWVTTTSPPSHPDTTNNSMMSADMVCCRYVECLERVYVKVASYINDLQDIVASAIRIK